MTLNITFLYKEYGYEEFGLRPRKFRIKSEKDLLEMVLWLTASCIEGPQKLRSFRTVYEVIINKHHFPTGRYFNPQFWMDEIKSILKEEKVNEH